MKYPGFEFVRTTVAYNKHGEQKKFVHGGTGIVCINQLIHRITASGADERGLGRWSWMAFQGNNGITVRIISAYQPCKVLGPFKNHTVYRQHIQYCKCALIHKWVRKGDKIILLVDANESAVDGSLDKMLQTIGLHSAPCTKFG